MQVPKSFRPLEIAKPNIVRTLLVAALLGGLVFALGWLFASTRWGLVLALWSLVLGPLVMPWCVRMWAKRTRGLRRLNLAAEWSLAGAYFECLLKRPGLHPEVWIFESLDPIVFWEEPVFFGRTRIYVSRGWLKADAQRKVREWTRLWDELVALKHWGRRVRGLQWRLWTGPVSLLAMLFEGLAWALRILGFRDLPTPAFWFQRAGWALRGLWMRLPRGPAEFALPRRGTTRPPEVWNSLILGPWAQISSAANCHPTWRILVHRSAFLEAVS